MEEEENEEYYNGEEYGYEYEVSRLDLTRRLVYLIDTILFNCNIFEYTLHVFPITL